MVKFAEHDTTNQTYPPRITQMDTSKSITVNNRRWITRVSNEVTSLKSPFGGGSGVGEGDSCAVHYK